MSQYFIGFLLGVFVFSVFVAFVAFVQSLVDKHIHQWSTWGDPYRAQRWMLRDGWPREKYNTSLQDRRCAECGEVEMRETI